jgi:hypothetical protein
MENESSPHEQNRDLIEAIKTKLIPLNIDIEKSWHLHWNACWDQVDPAASPDAVEKLIESFLAGAVELIKRKAGSTKEMAIEILSGIEADPDLQKEVKELVLTSLDNPDYARDWNQFIEAAVRTPNGIDWYRSRFENRVMNSLREVRKNIEADFAFFEAPKAANTVGGTPGAVETGAEKPKVLETENVFHKDSEDLWELRFQGGGIFHLIDSKGLNHISLLLQHPNQSFLAADMVHTLHPEAMDDALGGNKQKKSEPEPNEKEDIRKKMKGSKDNKSITRREIAQYEAELKRIDEEIESTDDLAKKAELEKAKKFFIKELQRRNAPILDNHKRQRQAVTKAIKEAIEKIKKESPDLAQFLSQRIKCSSQCVYYPPVDNPPEWIF